MRTTISIDEDLLEQLKLRATREGKSISRLIEDSVRLAAAAPADAVEAFELVTFGGGGRFTELDIDRTSALAENDDLAAYGRGR